MTNGKRLNRRTAIKNIYYIYKHTFPNGILYIGKGKHRRAYCLSNRNKYYNHLLEKYGNPNIEILLDNLCEEEAFNKEMETIKECKEKKFILCNLTNGGEGISGYSQSIEAKIKISKRHKGKITTEETKEKLRVAQNNKFVNKEHYNKGKKHSEETKEKMRIARIGKETTLPIRINENEYIFFHKDFGFEKTTVSGLYKKYNLPPDSIYKISNNKRKSAYGWIIEP